MLNWLYFFEDVIFGVLEPAQYFAELALITGFKGKGIFGHTNPNVVSILRLNAIRHKFT
jgi:hypothetical protein